LARIAGVDLPKGKRIEIGLTYVYGIGRSLSRQILGATGVDLNTKVKDLSDADVSKLRAYIDQSVKVEGDLRRELAFNVKRLMDIGCYRGLRHRKGLPCRGQRTHTNARTRKGHRRNVGIKKKTVTKA
jgi:small subunit ribosomal protein S13